MAYCRYGGAAGQNGRFCIRCGLPQGIPAGGSSGSVRPVMISAPPEGDALADSQEVYFPKGWSNRPGDNDHRAFRRVASVNSE